jgi:hypothetical protein
VDTWLASTTGDTIALRFLRLLIPALFSAPGAKMGANIARHQATSGHNEPVSSQVNGMLGYKQRRLATAQA